MHRCRRFRRGSIPAAFPMLLVALLVAPSAGSAKTGAPSGLSPRLAELAKPSAQGDSPARQARAVGLAVSGPGSLLRRGNRILVYVHFNHGAITALPAIRSAGGEIVD